MIDNELYRVYDGTLAVYDVTNQEKPKPVSSVHIGWTVETIYPTPSHLFIGGQLGMYIFDRSNPQKPRQISQIEHARACDPVVVSGSTAFVTLRATNCGPAQDELLCVNIKDPMQPSIVGTKPLKTPWGLAVQHEQLYVSHGQSGYSLLNVSNPQQPAVVATWPAIPTRDFLWFGNTLFVLTDDNVLIYDVSDRLSPVLISKVEPDGSS